MSEHTRPCATCQYLLMLQSYPPKYKCELSNENVEYHHKCDYDIVPVIRCGKCRYWQPPNKDGEIVGVCIGIAMRAYFTDGIRVMTSENQFCCWGERRDG